MIQQADLSPRARAISEDMMSTVVATDPDLSAAIDAIYEEMGDSMAEAAEEYHRRHMTASMGILTVYDPERARQVLRPLRGIIAGKSVVEVGAGVGVLAMAMARYCTHVYAIESDPAWSWAFTKHLYAKKPANLTWIFGRAEEVASWLRADIALVVTRSGAQNMLAVAKRMAPTALDVYASK